MSLWTEAHRCISETRLDKDEYTGPLRNNKTVDPEEAEEEESKPRKKGTQHLKVRRVTKR